jgi:hypothetical protein
MATTKKAAPAVRKPAVKTTKAAPKAKAPAKTAAKVEKEGRVDERKNKPSAYSGKGRPAFREGALEPLQTRVPSQLRDYLKALPVLTLPDGRRYGSQQVMFEEMLLRFIAGKPWKEGLAWRRSRAAVRYKAGEVQDGTGWVQINMMVEPDLAEAVRAQVERLAMSPDADPDLSVASFCYTAAYWWAQYVYPAGN